MITPKYRIIQQAYSAYRTLRLSMMCRYKTGHVRKHSLVFNFLTSYLPRVGVKGEAIYCIQTTGEEYSIRDIS